MSIFACLHNYLADHLSYLYYPLIFLGFTSVFKVFMTIAKGVFKMFRKRINFKQRYGQNAWALVTGGSQGIGRELACELASQGINIVLLSRTETKLKYAQEYIQTKHPQIKVEYIVADLLKQAQKQHIQDLLPSLNKYKFSIIVNNAGMDVFDHYQNIPVQKIIDLIHLNCFSVLALTYKYGKEFDERTNRGQHCAIVNVASLAGEIPVPFFDVYSASKAYVLRLTKCLAIDMPKIDWLVLNPSEVSTAMTGFKNLDIFTITPESCASATLDAWGHDLVTNGPLGHKIQSFLYSLLSEKIFNTAWFALFAPQFLADRRKMQEQANKIRNLKKSS